MIISSYHTIDLEHRAYHFLRNQYAANVLLVASDEENISLISRKFTIRRILTHSIRSASLDSSGNVIAVVSGKSGSLLVKNLAEDAVFRTSGILPDDHAQRDYKEYGFDDSFFDKSGFLWCVMRKNVDEIICQIRAPDNWSVMDAITLDDPYGISSCSFHEAPEYNTVMLWIAAGQDGQQMYKLWLKNTTIQVEELTPLENSTPLVFSDTGHEFLVLQENYTIARFGYPNIHKLGACEYVDEDEIGFGSSISYLNEKYAIVSMAEERLMILDIDTMKMTEEVILQSHEPRPTEEYYPTLKGDKKLCTDISFFQGVDDMLVFVYRRDKEKDLNRWKDSLIFVNKEEIRKCIS